GAMVALAIRHVVAIGEEPVLERVDAELYGFTERDRAQMPRELQAALVRLFDRRAERGAADGRVRLEPRHAFVGPIVDDAPRLLRRRHLRHRRRSARTCEIWAGEMNARSRRLAA